MHMAKIKNIERYMNDRGFKKMFKMIKNFFNFYNPIPEKKVNTKTGLSHSIEENIRFLKSSFGESADFTLREMSIGSKKQHKAAIITIEGMVNKDALALCVTNRLVGMLENTKDACELFEYIATAVLSSSEQVELTSFDEVLTLAMSGFAIFTLDGCDKMLAIGLQGFSFRGVSEPESEVVQRGSREGFVEPLRINMSLMRRRLKNPDFRMETMQVGSISKTDVCVCYLAGTVSQKILAEVKRRLSSCDLQTVFASGYLVPYLEDEKDFSLFSGVGLSERPDTVCGKISEGRVAIIVDGTPGALIVPHLFTENFQTLDDYTHRPYYATFARWLKYLAFFVAGLTPGLYVALASYHTELFPVQLLTKVAVSIGSTPLTVMPEVLLIHFIYEVMREAGLRLPRPLGHAVSIVGALVIGETAVNAGLIGSPTLMVVAFSAISSYVIPDLYAPLSILRLVFIVVAGVAGIWGIALMFCAVLINMCAKKSFGIPFTAPVSPFDLFSMRDVLVRASWKTLSRKQNMVQSFDFE